MKFNICITKYILEPLKLFDEFNGQDGSTELLTIINDRPFQFNHHPPPALAEFICMALLINLLEETCTKFLIYIMNVSRCNCNGKNKMA